MAFIWIFRCLSCAEAVHRLPKSWNGGQERVSNTVPCDHVPPKKDIGAVALRVNYKNAQDGRSCNSKHLFIHKVLISIKLNFNSVNKVYFNRSRDTKVEMNTWLQADLPQETPFTPSIQFPLTFWSYGRRKEANYKLFVDRKSRKHDFPDHFPRFQFCSGCSRRAEYQWVNWMLLLYYYISSHK